MLFDYSVDYIGNVLGLIMSASLPTFLPKHYPIQKDDSRNPNSNVGQLLVCQLMADTEKTTAGPSRPLTMNTL